MDKLDEIRERAEKATAGPWIMQNEPEGSGFFGTIHGNAGVSFSGNKADNDFIAHSREDIPYLLAEITRLRAENERLRAELSDPRTVRLPCAVGDTVYAIVHCENIITDIDDDYETGTGAVECPFESDCPFEDCDDGNRRIVKTACSGFYFDGTKTDVFLDRINAEIYTSDFGKTVFLSPEEAEKAKEAGK